MSRATEKRVGSERSAVPEKGTAGLSPTIERARLRYTGALSALSPDERDSLMRRTSATSSLVRERTEEIVRRVRGDGDRALREMAVAFDGVSLDALEVPAGVRRRALAEIDRALRSALEHAA